MPSAETFELTLLPGARELLEQHAEELPQRDDLCGAFCAALALRAAGIARLGDEPLDQDAVAVAAGSTVSAVADPSMLPHGEPGRRDYRLTLPTVADAGVSGTTAAGLVEAIERLARGELAALALAGPWNVAALTAVFDVLSTLEQPAAMLANLATRHLWGSHTPLSELLEQLATGAGHGAEPDWDVGHFACVVGRIDGAGGSLYALADTYPALGRGGVHLQPPDRLALALERPEMPEGGVIAVVDADDAPSVRDVAAALGVAERVWDNGSVTAETLG